MTEDEALNILGLNKGATWEDIRVKTLTMFEEMMQGVPGTKVPWYLVPVVSRQNEDALDKIFFDKPPESSSKFVKLYTAYELLLNTHKKEEKDTNIKKIIDMAKKRNSANTEYSNALEIAKNLVSDIKQNDKVERISCMENFSDCSKKSYIGNIAGNIAGLDKKYFWPHGYGTKKDENGDEYTGTIIQNKRSGLGKLTTGDGKVYTGFFKDGIIGMHVMIEGHQRTYKKNETLPIDEKFLKTKLEKSLENDVNVYVQTALDMIVKFEEDEKKQKQKAETEFKDAINNAKQNDSQNLGYIIDNDSDYYGSVKDDDGKWIANGIGYKEYKKDAKVHEINLGSFVNGHFTFGRKTRLIKQDQFVFEDGFFENGNLNGWGSKSGVEMKLNSVEHAYTTKYSDSFGKKNVDEPFCMGYTYEIKNEGYKDYAFLKCTATEKPTETVYYHPSTEFETGTNYNLVQQIKEKMRKEVTEYVTQTMDVRDKAKKKKQDADKEAAKKTEDENRKKYSPDTTPGTGTGTGKMSDVNIQELYKIVKPIVQKYLDAYSKKSKIESLGITQEHKFEFVNFYHLYAKIEKQKSDNADQERRTRMEEYAAERQKKENDPAERQKKEEEDRQKKEDEDKKRQKKEEEDRQKKEENKEEEDKEEEIPKKKEETKEEIIKAEQILFLYNPNEDYNYQDYQKAQRLLSLLFHPDTCSFENEFCTKYSIIINEAKKTLKDKIKIKKTKQDNIICNFNNFIAVNKISEILKDLTHNDLTHNDLTHNDLTHNDSINIRLLKYGAKSEPEQEHLLHFYYKNSSKKNDEKNDENMIFTKLVAHLIVSTTYYTLMKFHGEKQSDLIEKIQFNKYKYDNLNDCITDYKNFILYRNQICETIVVDSFKQFAEFNNIDDANLLEMYHQNNELFVSPLIEHFNISDTTRTTNIIDTKYETYLNSILDKFSSTIIKIREILENNKCTDNPIITDEQIVTFLLKNSKSWDTPLKTTISDKKINHVFYSKIMEYRDKQCKQAIVEKFKALKKTDLNDINDDEILTYYHSSFDLTDRKHSPFLHDFIGQEYNDDLFKVKDDDTFFKPIFEKMVKTISDQKKHHHLDNSTSFSKLALISAATAAATAGLYYAYKKYNKSAKKSSNKSSDKRSSAKQSKNLKRIRNKSAKRSEVKRSAKRSAKRSERRRRSA
jgi:hypothetical protein